MPQRRSYKHYPWHCLPLGKMSDPKIARRYGMSQWAVGRARRRRELSAWAVRATALIPGLIIERLEESPSASIPFREIYDFVVDQFRMISSRHLYRVLAKMVVENQIKRDRTISLSSYYWGYQLVAPIVVVNKTTKPQYKLELCTCGHTELQHFDGEGACEVCLCNRYRGAQSK